MGQYVHTLYTLPRCPPTRFIQFVHVNQLGGVLHVQWLSLLVEQEVEQVPGTHLTLRLSVLRVDHVHLLPVGQQVIEVLDLGTFQGAGVGLVTFLREVIIVRESIKIT